MPMAARCRRGRRPAAAVRLPSGCSVDRRARACLSSLVKSERSPRAAASHRGSLWVLGRWPSFNPDVTGGTPRGWQPSLDVTGIGTPPLEVRMRKASLSWRGPSADRSLGNSVVAIGWRCDALCGRFTPAPSARSPDVFAHPVQHDYTRAPRGEGADAVHPPTPRRW